MNPLFKYLPILSIASLLAGCSAFNSSFRKATVSDLEWIRIDQIDSLKPEEFRSIEETVRKADQFGKMGLHEISERYYRLAYVKTEMLKRSLESVDRATPARDETSRQSAGDAGTGGSSPSQEDGSASVKADPDDPPGRGEGAACPPESSAAAPPAAPPREQETSVRAGTTPQKTVQKDVDARADNLIGRQTVYLVKTPETVKSVAAKTGASWRAIARDNRLDPKKPLEPGTILRIDTRRIVPRTVRNGIVINIPDRTLYLFKEGRLKRTYPVGLGMGKLKDASSWETPTGKFRITSKVKDPNWYVPYSIQQKLKKEGKDFTTVVPPGPKNPLGKYALCTTMDGILIHGTTNPGSVDRFRSHGCIRLLPRHMEEFFNAVRINTGGEIIYEPVKAAVSDNGRVFLEVHADPYRKVRDLETETRRVLEGKNAMDLVDWQKVKRLLKAGGGIVEDVTASM